MPQKTKQPIGIELAKRISSNINYIRAIDMNNTVMEFEM